MTTNPDKLLELSFEAQLQNYKRKISNILESFTDAFFELDTEWVVTYWNKEAERLLQKSRKDIIGKNIWEVYKEAIPLKFYSEYHRAVSENIAVRFQEYFAPFQMWIEVAAFPSGEGLSVYFKDITANKLAAEQLEKEKQRYVDLFNLSPLPQWVYDLETLAFLNVNEAAIKHYGYSKAEFLQMTINDIRPKEDLDRLRAIFANDITIGYSNQAAVRHCKKNGELMYVTVEGNSVWFEDKQARLVLVIDLTEHIKAERALAASEQRFRAMVQDGSDLITIIDQDGTYKYVSPTSFRILGIKATDLLGKNSFEFIHPDDRQGTVSDFRQLKYQKQAELPPFRFKNAKGEYRWIETIITNMIDDPAIEGIICNSRDITERIESRIKMEESISRLKEIAWIQSHEIRAPLARIMGLVDLLEEFSAETDKKDVIKHLKTSSQELDVAIRAIMQNIV